MRQTFEHYRPFPTKNHIPRAIGWGIPVGPQWDEDAQLYYFNARWYDPETGRFITEDPVRDGLLWDGYVNNNPMGFVDHTRNYIVPQYQYTMQDEAWAVTYDDRGIKSPTPLANSKADSGWFMKSSGCYMTSQAGAIRALTGVEVTPGDMNIGKYNSENGFNYSLVNRVYNLNFDYWTEAKQGDLAGKISELKNNPDKGFVIRALVPITEGKAACHWVGVADLVSFDGLDGFYIAIIPTSKFDTALNENGEFINRPNDGSWIVRNGIIYVKSSVISRMEQLNSDLADQIVKTTKEYDYYAEMQKIQMANSIPNIEPSDPDSDYYSEMVAIQMANALPSDND